MKLKDQIKQIILDAQPEHGVLQGVRRFTKGLPMKRVGYFPSVKNDGLMPCESGLEADHCLRLEFEKPVVRYQTQPLTLDLGNQGKYTPDTGHIDTIGDVELREVKFSGALQDPKVRDFHHWLKRHLAEQGIRFRVLTELEIRRAPDYENARYLYRASHLRYSSHLLDQALATLTELGGRVALSTLRKALAKQGLPPLLADRLLLLKRAYHDTSRPLSSDSTVWC